jgi:hypothetical protein
MHIHRNDIENITALRAKRQTAAGSARLHKHAENYVVDASQPHESRDKTLRQFTRAQVQARQHIPAAKRGAISRSRIMSPKTYFRDKTRRDITPRNKSRSRSPRDARLASVPSVRFGTPLMIIYG